MEERINCCRDRNVLDPHEDDASSSSDDEDDTVTVFEYVETQSFFAFFFLFY